MARDGMLAGGLFKKPQGHKTSQVFSNTTYFSNTKSVCML